MCSCAWTVLRFPGAHDLTQTSLHVSWSLFGLCYTSPLIDQSVAVLDGHYHSKHVLSLSRQISIRPHYPIVELLIRQSGVPMDMHNDVGARAVPRGQHRLHVDGPQSGLLILVHSSSNFSNNLSSGLDTFSWNSSSSAGAYTFD
jgi:hypothetical protein